MYVKQVVIIKTKKWSEKIFFNLKKKKKQNKAKQITNVPSKVLVVPNTPPASQTTFTCSSRKALQLSVHESE